jgi:hypothetical protein
MAFNYSSFCTISRCLQQIVSANSPGPVKLLSIGYPDFIIERSIFENSAHSNIFKSSVLVNQEPIMRWHKLSAKNFVAVSLFKALSASFSINSAYSDIDIGTGISDEEASFIQLDLNSQCESSNGKFDIILDSGTSEHCFNIAQVFRTYHSLLALGGYLYQWTPFLSPNHGFYSLNPTFYYDLGREGAFTLEQFNMKAFRGYHNYFRCKSRAVAFRPVSKFRLWPWNFSSVILNEALLKKGSLPFTFPVQSKYLKGPLC